MVSSIWIESFASNSPNGTLRDIATISSGKRPPVKRNDISNDFIIPVLGASSVMGFTNQTLYSERIIVTGRVGTHGVLQRFNRDCWASDNTLVIKSKSYEFVYQILKSIDFSNMNRGSTQPLITQSDLNKVPIYIPPSKDILNFEITVEPLMSQYELKMIENEKLVQIRDTLLPKLMSGEITID